MVLLALCSGSMLRAHSWRSSGDHKWRRGSDHVQGKLPLSVLSLRSLVSFQIKAVCPGEGCNALEAVLAQGLAWWEETLIGCLSSIRYISGLFSEASCSLHPP